MSNILNFLTSSSWPEFLGVIAAFVLAFDRLAKLTPTQSDNAIVTALYRVFAILGIKVADNPGEPPK